MKVHQCFFVFENKVKYPIFVLAKTFDRGNSVQLIVTAEKFTSDCSILTRTSVRTTYVGIFKKKMNNHFLLSQPATTTFSPPRLQLCHLCGLYGHGRKDILDKPSNVGSSTALSETISRCLGLRVSDLLISIAQAKVSST